MITATDALSAIPEGLRGPLIAEYQSIVQNFLERRWLPSELGGGRFSEVVYTVLDGFAKHRYAASPSKPSNFAEACRKLENNATAPRSFQILIPRLLPALYEIRNNRNVGHIGGDVDPNHMDAVAVLSVCNWIMAELVRVFHGLSVAEAQQVVDRLAEIRIPIIWSDGDTKRVLRPELAIRDQVLLLVATASSDVGPQQLLDWTEYRNTTRFDDMLHKLHSARLIEFDVALNRIRILPPGTKYIQELIRKKNVTGIS